MRRLLALSLALAAVMASVAVLAAVPQAAGRRHALSFATGSDAMAVVSFAARDACPADGEERVAAVSVWVDGRYEHEVLLFPGSGRGRYDTLLGPLARGRHLVELRPSSFWQPAPCLQASALNADVVGKDAPAHEVLARAPVLQLRADTVGEQTDVPLYAYVEDDVEGSGRRVRYSVVFSNEDGGTPTRALLARWGRTTDIEQVYELEMRDGRVVREEFQGPDHEIRPFAGRRRGVAPVLLVATLNNMVTDRGRGAAQVRLVPGVADLSRATRESTMDPRPWAYRVMWRELTAEGRIGPTAHGSSRSGVFPDEPAGEGRAANDAWLRRAPDPRDHVYLEARLVLRGATAAAWARDGQGKATFSHYGRAALAVDRNGWVRLAVPFRRGGVPSVGWSCLPGAGQAGTGTCRIEAARAFVFDEGWVPGANLVVPATLELRAGEEAGLQPARR